MRRRGLLGLALLGFLVFVASGLRLTDDLMRLVPAEGELAQAMELLDRFRIADTLLIEVDGTGVEREDLLAAVDELGERLREDPDFGVVRFRTELQDGRALQQAAAPHAVALIPAERLTERLSREGIERTLLAQLVRLSGPGGALFEAQFLADPLDLTTLALQGLSEGSAPFNIRVQSNHFLDSSGLRALLIVEPAIKVMEMGPDAPFVDKLEAQLAQSALPARWMGGHRVASDAAGLIRDDIQRAALLGMAGLTLLFLLGFRSMRPLVAGVLPLALAAAACFAAARFLSPIHGISLGFAGALLGLAVDYWVHLYCAASARSAGTFQERLDAALLALKDIQPALLVSAASTGAACLVLTTSSYPVVRDLGAMGLGATAGALAGTFLLGPLAFALIGARKLPRWSLPSPPPALRGLVVVGAVVLGLVGLTVSFDGDPRKLSPSARDTQALMEELGDRYGGFGTGGMAVVSGEQALDQAEHLQQAVSAIPGLNAVGVGRILPGPATVKQRASALPSVPELQARIDEAAEALALTPEAVAGLAESIHERSAAPGPETWSGTPLTELVHTHVSGDSVMVSLVVPEDGLVPSTEAVVSAVAPGAQLVLPSRFAANGVKDIASEILRLGSLGFFAILLLLALRFRSPRVAVAALLPSVAACAAAAGTLALAGMPFNGVSSCVVVLTIGLGLDYGVFMVGAVGHKDSSRYAVGMSALTTMVGFGAMLATSTPALFSVGLAAAGGIAAAGVVALTLSAPLARAEQIVPRWLRRVAWVALLLANLHAVLHQFIFLAPPPSGKSPVHSLEGGELARSFGPNRFVQAEGMRVVYLEGDPYERGYAHSVLVEDLHRQLEVENLDNLERAVPNPLARLFILESSMVWARGLSAHLREEDQLEIRGLVDGAIADPFSWFAPAFTRRIYYHAIHDIGQAWADSSFVMACSGFAGRTPEGEWLLGRNFDFDGGSVFDRHKVVQFVRPDEGHAYVSVAFSGMLGVVTGMNDQGLAVAIQAVQTDDPPIPGTPMTLMVRELLQTASSLDEVESILRARKGFVGENVLVIDAQAEEAALFELTPDALVRVPVEDRMAVTNHFRSAELGTQEANERHLEDDTTGPRLARLETLLWEEDLSLERGTEIMTDRNALDGTPLPRGHRHAIDADIATHSVVLNASTGELWVSRWPNTAGGYVRLDLYEALSGHLEPIEVVEAGDIQATLDVHRGRELLREARDADPEEAERLSRRALLLMPKHPEALTELAAALLAQGRREEALPYIEEALAAPPEYADQARLLESWL